jgi:hypothetical protein
MSTGAVVGIIIVILVIAALAIAAVMAMGSLRRARLQRQFGPEYDRLVKARGRKKAEAELTERQRRAEALEIHQLTPEQQASYSGDWTAIQERFVDAPVEAVGAAHTLIWNVMRDRGYPTDDRTASMDALSVHHGRSMEGYRMTQDLRADSASTEQLREAMIRYRAMFEDLTGLREGRGEPARERVAAIQERAADPHAAADRHAVADNGTRTAETAEPASEARATRDPVAEDSDVEDRDLAVRNDERAAESASQTANPPR